MKCSYCGTDNAAGEDFCANCGAHLGETNDATIVSRPVQMTASASESENGEVSNTMGSAMTLTPSATLEHGRYVVEKVLGQGGMGAAVLARDTRVANKRVVIKELISEGSDPEQRQEDVRNFEREVDMLAQLDHPLVPTVTDSFQESTHYYMVQEYAPGENLEDYLERVKKPMPEQEALTYISQVLDILDYLGNRQPPVVHRDIKPANIIISSKDKRARLVDFGIARADEAKHARRKQTTALGTPGYAPPEQYQGNADARSDLYALAATLHHLVTNRDPRNFAPFNYPSARSLNSQISPELDHVLTKALALSPGDRYQNAAEMKHVIDDILQRRYHVANNNSSYLLNTSQPLKSAPREEYGRGYGGTDNQRRTGQTGGPRPRQMNTPYGGGPAGSPRPMQSPYSGPLGGLGGPQQQQQMQRQNMYDNRYGPFPQQQFGQYGPPQEGNDNRFVVYSFLLLVVVVIGIGILFFLLPFFNSIFP